MLINIIQYYLMFDVIAPRYRIIVEYMNEYPMTLDDFMYMSLFIKNKKSFLSFKTHTHDLPYDAISLTKVDVQRNYSITCLSV